MKSLENEVSILGMVEIACTEDGTEAGSMVSMVKVGGSGGFWPWEVERSSRKYTAEEIP